MVWLLLSLILSVLIELFVVYISSLALQRLLSLITIAIIAIDTIAIVGLEPTVWTFVLGYLSVFRIVNLIKLFSGRKQMDYLRSSVFRSSLNLGVFQLIVLGLEYILNSIHISFHDKWSILIVLQLVAIFTVVMSLRRSLNKTKPKLKNTYVEDKDLPSLTVAIPARNEDYILEDCLRTVIASDYPKLEIIVLDDCSQDKRTPDIIRQFAQDGVRFLAGKAPSDSWTAKNYAYQQLADEASGELILFCGVDVIFDTKTIRKMVEMKIKKRKNMFSFMPVNSLPDDRFKRLLIQPLRYLWELGLPRRSLNRPPVLSTCWLIDRQILIDNGGFKAVSRNIVPERYFARQTARSHDGYSFVCLGTSLGLLCSKSFEEQQLTAIRTRYPSLRQRPENVAIVSLIEATVFIVPLGLFIYELIYSSWILALLCLVNIVSTSVILFVISEQTYRRRLPSSLVLYPVIFIYDIALGLYSMWQYEFNDVLWKGRNVCIPVMTVFPSLGSEHKS